MGVIPPSSGAADAPSTSSTAARGRILLLLLILAIVPLASYRRSLAGESGAASRGGSDDTMGAYNSYRLNTPLFEAVKGNDLERTRELLEEGMKVRPNKMVVYNPNCEDAKGITPLIEATLLGNYDLVILLLQYGGKAQPDEGFRHTPLRAACLTANVPLIKLLLDRGADPNAKSEGGRTPLMGACFLRPQYDQSPDRLKLSQGAVRAILADSRTDVRATNDFGESALDLCRTRLYGPSMPLLRERIQTQHPNAKRLRRL
mmetsp:Transcript_38171/g.91379  ORF Transcript_38171/g.91379 Transcript_38171/m.91379 type:complete len:260 (-) Transcript_38171:381-1160(-)